MSPNITLETIKDLINKIEVSISDAEDRARDAKRALKVFEEEIDNGRRVIRELRKFLKHAEDRRINDFI